ncbi:MULTISPECIES: SusC/RagA family TonB-linked outer membrane protein [Altibacter]|uniref:SusC/RagA family TonB-linked outer membrane protein n=1 Tax=Altibacter TaxID=1535231 RepID=UPI000551F698|nr:MULTISPECIES: SusC/RagA family TonB-linked outer membrane protein [Altibacter]MCW9036659.1 SusC/RagA family TonB-linked outer membrane protein [Altibacter sp.]
MRTKFSGILTLLLAFVVQLTFAQEKTISGTVSDNTGLPLPGVNIVVKGTSSGTQTDFDGNYSIQASVGQTLVFSYVGFTTVERPITGASSDIDVLLQEDAAVLNEVIINAIGLTRKKDDDLTSTTTVQSESITRSGEVGVATGLAGKTSGVNVVRGSGDPGAGAFIQIRGANTIQGDDEPLYVIDGVLINNFNFGAGVAGVSEQSRLNDIPAEDIESVSVLKGASAVAIYGTGAANGVIVIKTKSGRGAAGKWNLNYKSSIYVDEVNERWDLQSKYGQGTNGMASSFNGAWGDLIASRPGGPDLVDTSSLQRFEALDGTVYYPIIEKRSRETFLESNFDAVIGTGLTFENDLSLDHSGENGNTYISASEWNQEGIIKNGSNYVRRAMRFNNTTNFSDKLSARVSASYVKTEADAIQSGSNLNGLYLGLLRTPADFDNRDYKGTAFDAQGNAIINAQRGYRTPLGPIPVYNNPLWTVNEQVNTINVDRITMSPEITYKFSDNVFLTARYNKDSYRDRRREFFPFNSGTNENSITGTPTTGEGFFGQDERFVSSDYATAFLSVNHDISDNFNFNWIVGTTYEDNKLEQFAATATTFVNPFITLSDLIDVGNAAAENIAAFNFTDYSKQVGAYVLVEGEIFNQVLFNLTGRMDRSSTLPDQNFYYPAASLGWKFSEAIGDNNILSFGKLRASYGEVAVAPISYSLSSGFVGGGVGSSWGDALSGDQYGSVSSLENTQGNPNLVVERVKEIEGGVDLRFFNNRLSLNGTYYDRKTEDVLLDRVVAPSSGFTALTSNAATITNKGLELDMSATIIKTDDFSWKINANYSMNDNLVMSPDGNGELLTVLNGFTGSASSVYDGQPFAVFAGEPLLRDENGNLELNDFGFPVISTEGEQVLGDPNPDWIGGLGTEFAYKGFELSALFDFRQGMDVWNGTLGVLNHFGVTSITANEVTVSAADAATIVNFQGVAIADLPNAQQNADGSYTVRGNLDDFGAGTVLLDQAWYNGGTASGFNGSSELYVEDASYVKLRQITLSYSFPTRLIEHVGLESLSLAVSGRNLVTWSDIEGFDPDNNLTGASKGRGLEYFTNPSTASYQFTLRLGL